MAYVDFLKTGPARWKAAGRPGDLVGYIWPIVGRLPLALDRIDALSGRFSPAAATPLTSDTRTSAYCSAPRMPAALVTVTGSDRHPLDSCRLPRHTPWASYPPPTMVCMR